MIGASSTILKLLSERKAAPKYIQLTPLGGGYFASVYDDDTGHPAISEWVSMGFDRTPELATLKGLAEWLERMAFRKGSETGTPGCDTFRSDGFAAFPLISNNYLDAKQMARQHAYCEAIERYAWASWWDDNVIGHVSHSDSAIPLSGLCSQLLCAARHQVGVDRYEIVIPNIAPPNNEALIIIIAHLTPTGTLTGGAVGRLDDPLLWERASAELFRHCLALRRILTGESAAISFYERRIEFFGSGKGNALVKARLSCLGSQYVELPALAFDDEISFAHSDLVYVHRCLFENQPPFIGGHLERLCF